MNNIQEVIRTKELELLKVVEEALEQREAELRQVQSNLLEALRVVNSLLAENTTTGAAEASLPGPKLAPPVTTSAGVAKAMAVGQEPIKRFP